MTTTPSSGSPACTLLKLPGCPGVTTEPSAPSGSKFTLFLTFSRPVPLATFDGLPLSVLMPAFNVSEAVPSPDRQSYTITMTTNGTPDEQSAIDGLKALVDKIKAILIALGISIGSVAFIADGGPQAAGKLAANGTKALAGDAGGVAKAASIVSLLIAAFIGYELLKEL